MRGHFARNEMISLKLLPKKRVQVELKPTTFWFIILPTLLMVIIFLTLTGRLESNHPDWKKYY